MLRQFWNRFRRQKAPPARLPQQYNVVLTAHCVQEITEGMASSVELRHEGIAYLIGLTTGTTTLAASARFPDAATTMGSFEVDHKAMANVIGEAARLNLQVVGQIHTHPAAAFHSQGDLKGMRIRHPGYFSVVLPMYGTLLPSLQDSHTLVWDENGFREVDGPIKIL